MAEDDVISAIWSSLVRPPTTVEEESTEDFSVWNDCNGGMTVELYNNNYYAEEGILANHSAQYYHDGTSDYWNRREMVQDYYPQEEVFFREAATVVDVKTLFDAVEEDGKAMVCWNEQEEITVHGYPEDGEAFAGDEIPADVVVESIFCSAADVQRSTEDVRSEPHNDKQTEDVTNRLTYGSDEPLLMIRRMPETVTAGERNPFKPKFLPIGPYHHGKMKTLPSIQALKEECVDRVYKMNKKIPRSAYARKLMDAEKKVKKYYDSSISEMRGCELARSLMLDACVVLELLDLFWWVEKQLEANMDSEPEMDREEQDDSECVEEMKDFPFTSRIAYDGPELYDFLVLWYDFLPIENQIPFFVIDKVYELFAGKTIYEENPLRERIVRHLQRRILTNYPTSLTMDSIETKNFEYILHFCHNYFKPSNLSIAAESEPTEHQTNDTNLNGWYGATDLYESGVKFKGLKPSGRSLLDIEFKKMKLEIPTLVIDRRTYLLFSNIIAFEKTMMLDKTHKYFISYIRFMSKLIVGNPDVALLARKKIIKNNLGKEKEIIDFFSELIVQLDEGILESGQGSYLEPIYDKLNECVRSSSNRWLADVHQKYFKTPRLMIGLAIGALLLACSIISAVGAIYGIKSKK